METKLLRGEQEKDLQEAAQLLRAGEAVAFPTETVYGLGANALDETAARKIYEAKGRPSDNPLIVHIYDRKQLPMLTEDVPDAATRLMDAFWPGPLTIILKKKPGAVPDCVTGGLDTVGVRMPNHPVALRLLELADIPIAAPSANLSGKPSPTAASHVRHDLEGRVAAIVSGGSCAVGVESTVLDLSGAVPTILRPGGVTREQLEQVLGSAVQEAAPYTSDQETPRAPGMKYTHYAPDAPVYICTGTSEEVAAKIDAQVEQHKGKAGVMVSQETMRLLKKADENLVVNLGSMEDLKQITCNVFAALRYFDQLDVEAIYTEDFPTEEIGAALMNRLRKAAGDKNV
jgi:L-threonylcarbamoyladenylate synthase